MKTSELLTSLRLGSEVAESDDELQDLFVPIAAFHEMVYDEADLILGPKGSGKTAIFRMMADDDFAIASLDDVDILPAFNTQGDIMFQHLRREIGMPTEEQLRTVWTAYILTFAGWHIVEMYNTPAVEKLKEVLELAGLPQSGQKPQSIWKALVDRFARLTKPIGVEAKFGMGTGMPNVEGRLEYQEESPTPTPQKDSPFASLDVNAVVLAMIDALRSTGRRCWIIFDRLDEAFEDDPEFERLALRALMRAHSNISSYGKEFRTKLFLRDDVLDRVTNDAGFVNLTHLRSMRISWTRNQLLDMLVKRIIISDLALKHLHHRGVKNQAGVLRAILPTVNESSGKKSRGNRSSELIDPLTYLISKSSDATLEINPRNVISMIRSARTIELAACQVKDPELNGNAQPPIKQESFVRAWQQLSSKRLVDTLYAENNSLREIIESFRNGPQGFGGNFLRSHLNQSGVPSSEIDSKLRALQYCGFLKLTGRNLYRIADLYRPGLGLNPQTIKGAGAARSAEPELT